MSVWSWSYLFSKIIHCSFNIIKDHWFLLKTMHHVGFTNALMICRARTVIRLRWLKQYFIISCVFIIGFMEIRFCFCLKLNFIRTVLEISSVLSLEQFILINSLIIVICSTINRVGVRFSLPKTFFFCYFLSFQINFQLMNADCAQSHKDLMKKCFQHQFLILLPVFHY